MKKSLLFTFLFLFVLQTVSFAAVSGSKGATSAPRSAPSVSQPAAAPSTTTTAPGYKPSAPATSYSDKAPATVAKPQQPAPASTGSSFLRSAAMIGGGMLLGSMLGNMFGFGSSGMFAEIIGLLFNIMMVVLIFLAGRYAWMRYKAGKEKKDVRELH